MKVFILTEGGKNIGFGHVTRCISIYQAFEKRGVTPTMLINGNKIISNLVKDKRYELINWMEEEELFKILEEADIAILDSYLANIDFYDEFSRFVKIPVYIDDNNRINYPRGIVVNGTTYAKKLGFKKKENTKYLLGKEYALFREEFWKIPKKYIRKNISSILVFLGGTDRKNLTIKILKILKKDYKRLKKNVVVTDGFKNLDDLNKIKDENTSIIVNPDDKKIMNIMLSSDIAITSGGQTIYEICRVGIPVIVIAVADNQMRSINDLKNLGLIYYTGKWNDDNLSKKLKKYIEKLDSYSIRYKTSSKMRKVFDGKSTLHLIDELINYYKRYEYEKKT